MDIFLGDVKKLKCKHDEKKKKKMRWERKWILWRGFSLKCKQSQNYSHSLVLYFFCAVFPLIARENSISNVSFSYHFSPFFLIIPTTITPTVKTSVDVSHEKLNSSFFAFCWILRRCFRLEDFISDFNSFTRNQLILST